MNSKLIAVLALFLASVLFIAAVPEQSDAADTITVVDGEGVEYTLDGPTDKIVTVGVGVTATVIGVGAIDKIVVCDSYSKTNAAPVFDQLRQYIDQGRIAANGNIYSSGMDQLRTDIVNAADPETGTFDKGSDVVIVTGSDTYRANIVPYLRELGFAYVMEWSDIKDYGDIIGFVSTISMICNGSVHESVEQMENMAKVISNGVGGLEKRDATYVTYSGNVFKVGNYGSLATSMIAAAGGNVVTYDGGNTASTYEANLTLLVEQYPDMVLFVDNTIHSNAERLADLQRMVGDDIQLVPLDPIWNNYCIESMDGVWTMACAMYPDVFQGDVPEIDNGDSSNDGNMLLWVGVVIVVIVIIAAAVFFLKGRNA